MNRIRKSFVATFLALSSGSLAAADSYEVIELGTLGIYPTAAFSINDNGQIVGYTSKAAVDNENNFFTRAFSYQEPQIGDLGALEYSAEVTDGNKCEVVSSSRQDFSIAFANNGLDDAVGYSRRSVDRVRGGEVVTVCTCEDADGNDVNIACKDTLERAVIFDQATGNVIELP
ncbi:MAG: hypothetical protein OQJ89_11380, partial [Kangiellaceae bacterium]|nr:hypothetical protein [Kangiellaceae bacterium]